MTPAWAATVAIKVLPEGVAADPDRRRRFEQEARAVSALNHPHICVLFDIGDAVPTGPQPLAPGPSPVSYLVMEHLEGQTLAERLEGKGRPQESSPGRRGASDRHPDRRRARGRAQAGHHPSRPEARQRDADEGRRRIAGGAAGEAARLRPGAADGILGYGARERDAERVGRGRGHGALHGAGAGGGPAGGCAHGPLRLRRGALRDADGRARVWLGTVPRR